MKNMRCYLVVFLIFCLVIGVMPLNIGQVFAAEGTIDSAFSKMQIENQEGEVIEDLKDGSMGTTKLIPGQHYYLRVTVVKPEGYDYVGIRLGSKDQDGNLTPNGLKYLSPPGGVYDAGDIVHDSFDRLVSHTEIADLTYGSNNQKYVLKDGELLYHVKDSIKQDTYFDFEFSFTVDDTAYNNLQVLSKALSVTLYQNEDKSGTTKDVEIDVPVTQKKPLNSYYNPSKVNVVPGSGTVVSALISGEALSFLYDKIEYDIEYPVNSILEGVGYNTSYVRTSTQYGTLTVSEPEASQREGYQKVHVSFGPGYKKAEGDIWTYYKVVFPEEYFDAGQTQYSYLVNTKAFLKGNNENPLTASTERTVTYMLIDPNNDATTMTAQNRNVYNLTNDTEDEYYVQLGGARVENTASTETPQEKIIEASYNVTNTAAKIKAVTLPKGTKDNPVVELSGVDNSGQQKTIDITGNLLLKKATISGFSCDYYYIDSKKYGLEYITKIKADIGKIPGGFKTTGWSSVWTVDYNKLGAFGMFTTDEAGIEVINQFHIYNKDPETRHYKNGDLSCSSKAVSTLRNMLGMENWAFNMYDENGKNINNSPSIEAGRDVTIDSIVIPYSAVESACNTDGTDNGQGVMNAAKTNKVYGTTSAIADPVMYLYLPKGMNYKDLKFYLVKNAGVPGVNASGTVNLDYEISSVSYMNTKNDGVSIYKITFPEDTILGMYNGKGENNALRYRITFSTSRSMATGSYAFNDLIQLTNKTGLTGAVTSNKSTINIKSDTYQLNEGEYLLGATKGVTQTAVHLQEIAEIQVDNAISVTKINNESVAKPEWFTYQTIDGEADANTVALLGMKSEGQIRVKVTNRGSDPSNTIKIVMPIPKKGEDLGTMFVKEPFQYTMNVTWDESLLPEGFEAKYVMLDKQDGQGAFSYHEVASGEKGNAVLLSADSMDAKSSATAYFNYSINDGETGEINIFRTAHTYNTANNQVYNRIGSFVAAQVATGTVKGTVFYDKNRNGVQDPGEENMSGITVIVKDSKGRVQSIITDEEGHYQFDAVREEDVTLQFQIDKNHEVVGNYRLNVPVEGLDNSEDGLTASKKYESVDTLTEQNVPISTFYSVVYDANGADGNVPVTATCPENEFVTVQKNPDNLKKAGYVFKEWNTSQDGTGEGYLPGASVHVTEQACGFDENGVCTRVLKLYAIWEEAPYTIYLNYRGGNPTISCSSFTIKGLSTKVADAYKSATEEVMPVVWYSGGTKRSVGEINEPTKNGYDFDGWSTSGTTDSVKINSGTTLDSLKLTSDATLFATWIPKTGYNVTYDTKGGSDIQPQQNLSWNGYVSPSTKPTKPGYDFGGWKYKNTDVIKSTTYNSLAVDDNITTIELTAKWVEKSDFTVNYKDGEETIFDSKKVSWNSSELYPDGEPSKEGYAFEGWSLTQGDGQEALSPQMTYANLVGNDDTITQITLYPIWKQVGENDVIVKYDTKGGTVIGDKITTKDSANLLPAEQPFKAGYIFKEWKYNNGSADVSVGNDDTFQSLAGDKKTITLVAIWTDKPYKVNYDLAFELDDTDFPQQDKTWDETGLVPTTTPVYYGYSFAGWYFGDKELLNTDSISSLAPNDDLVDNTLTIIARWQKNSYSVEYDTGSGSYVEPKTGLSYDSDNLLPASNPVLKGYNCTGWTYDNEDIAASKKISELIGSEDIRTLILKAKYEEKTGYTVKYDTAGGTAVEDLTDVNWSQSNLIPDKNPTKIGFQFIGWISGRTPVTSTTSYSTIASSDLEDTFVTLVAEWSPLESEIIYKDGSNDYNWGDVNHPTRYTYGTPQELVNGTKENTRFYGWFRNSTFTGQNVERLSETEIADDNNQIVLYGKWVDLYQITVSTDGTEGCTATGGGTYEKDQQVTVTASAAEGYNFKGWKEGEEVVSTSSSYTFTAESGRNLVASFIPKYEISVTADPAEGGSVTGGGAYEKDQQVTVTASAAEGYNFKGWKEGDEVVSTSSSYTFTAESGRNLVASFIPKYEISVTADPAEGGSVTGGGTYEKEQQVTVTASAAEGYNFKGWKEGDEVVTTSSSYTFTAESGRNLVASFIPKYEISVIADPAEGGSVTGGGTYEKEQQVTVTASAAEGYNFKGWKEGDEVVTTSSSYTFTAESGRNLVASFIPKYEISVTADPAEGGSVTGGGTYEKEQQVTVTASAAEGYNFKGWKEGDEVVSTSSSYTFTAESGRNLVASFIPKYEISVTADPAEGGSVTGGGTYEKDQQVTVTASAAEGYNFKGWKEGEEVVSTSSSYTFTAESGRNLVATFEKKETQAHGDSSTPGSDNKPNDDKINESIGEDSNVINNDDNSNVINTGDNSNFALWIVLLLTSVLTTLVIALSKKKQ